MRTQSMSIKEFMSGEYKRDAKKDVQALVRKLYATGAASVVIVPKPAMAATYAVAAVANTASTFDHLWSAIMNIFDCGVVLVIAFAGGCWCLGHRPKALEILIGVCFGYLLARHAKDIRDFLKGV